MAAAAAFVAVPLTAASEQRAQPASSAPKATGIDGRDTRAQPTRRPTVEAAFARESYASGDLARLVVWTRGRRASLEVFRAGTERVSIIPRDLMLGSPVSTKRQVGDVANGDVIRVRIGEWPSGLYFAKLTAAGGKIGYAPFVLRPRSFGEHSIAVVFSTMTWQAYNFHDDNGDLVPDTWYQDQNDSSLTARLNRPYENRGVIPHYKYYDQPFVRWLVAAHPDVDYFADGDLDRASATGRNLAGMPTNDGQQISRLEALRLYTEGSAWFSFDDQLVGSIAEGKLADLAVLSADYLTVPDQMIRTIESVLTLVGGKIVHAAGPFARFAKG